MTYDDNEIAPLSQEDDDGASRPIAALIAVVAAGVAESPLLVAVLVGAGAVYLGVKLGAHIAGQSDRRRRG